MVYNIQTFLLQFYLNHLLKPVGTIIVLYQVPATCLPQCFVLCLTQAWPVAPLLFFKDHSTSAFFKMLSLLFTHLNPFYFSLALFFFNTERNSNFLKNQTYLNCVRRKAEVLSGPEFLVFVLPVICNIQPNTFLTEMRTIYMLLCGTLSQYYESSVIFIE